ncbi:MAG: guanylate kinase [Clostridia bacterium]|nr:guanylate kinase [Clostridia bacterium]
MNKGLLVIISGPAGSGKGTVIAELTKGRENEFRYSVSATTRKPRPTDVDGVTYRFMTREQFEVLIADGEMLEYAEYVDNYYGTPARPVYEALNDGKNVILEIETIGALKVKQKVPDAVMIMILPPDGKTLEARLRGRGTESDEVIIKRMRTAIGEVAKLDKYDYIVINDDGCAAKAAEDIYSILRAEKLKTGRNLHIRDDYFASEKKN